MCELSKQERVKLMDINNRLHELEKRIFDVIVKTERNLRSPQNSSKVDDYNIILDVFYKYKDDGEKIAKSLGFAYTEQLPAKAPNKPLVLKNQAI